MRPKWNDNGTFNQVIPIDPFSVTNLFLYYTVRSDSQLNGTKVRFGLNNLFDTRNVISVNPAAKSATFVPIGTDTPSLTPGRSISLTL